jgi:hypothetical protein
VYKAAAARVQQEFEDLEETWQQQHKQQMLLALPHGALLDLLKSDTLRVASENTVAYTIQAWAEYQQQQQQQRQRQQQGDGSQSEQQQYPSFEQLRQLALQIRMQHCSQPALHQHSHGAHACTGTLLHGSRVGQCVCIWPAQHWLP